MLMLKRLIIHIVIQQKCLEKTPVNNVIVIFIRCEMKNSIRGQEGSLLLNVCFQTQVIVVTVKTRLFPFHFSCHPKMESFLTKGAIFGRFPLK